MIYVSTPDINERSTQSLNSTFLPTRQLPRTPPKKSTPSEDKRVMLLMTPPVEPLSFEDVTTCREKEKWIAAIREELKAHDENKTWSVVETPRMLNYYQQNGCLL